MRPWRWLFPATDLLHVAEELWADFPVWISTIGGGTPATATQFLVWNFVGLALMTIAVLLSRRSFGDWLLAILGATVGINGFGHVIASAATGSYVPGTVSGLVICPAIHARTSVRSDKVGDGSHLLVAEPEHQRRGTRAGDALEGRPPVTRCASVSRSVPPLTCYGQRGAAFDDALRRADVRPAGVRQVRVHSFKPFTPCGAGMTISANTSGHSFFFQTGVPMNDAI